MMTSTDKKRTEMFLRKCLVYQNGDAQRAAGTAERFIAFRQAERLKISVDFLFHGRSRVRRWIDDGKWDVYGYIFKGW